MNDRELLELAAKALGINLYWTKDGNKLFRRDGGEQKPWNPLENDGDALRLVVKLRIDLDQYADSVRCLRSPDFDDWEGTEVVENLGKDPYAATRRAIVRAAAEIGKDMK
jgi:hypothetical protein